MFDTLRDVFDNVETDYAHDLGRYQNISQLFAVAVNVIMAIGFSVGLISITYSAIIYIMSGGNPDKTKKAWDTFIYGVVGAAIALGAIALKEIVLRGFGVDTSGIDELNQGHY